MPPPGQSLDACPCLSLLFVSFTGANLLYALGALKIEATHLPFAESVIIANKLIQEWMCIYSSTKEKKNMKSVWWLKLSTSEFLLHVTHRQGRLIYPCSRWRKKPGSGAGQWVPGSGGRSVMELFPGPELDPAGLGSLLAEARWLRTACVRLCKWLKLSALWHFLTSGVFLPGHGPKLTRKLGPLMGRDLRLFIVWLQCM